MFWDTSALVPCLVPEARSQDTSQLLTQDSAVTIWWAARVESASALEAKQRASGGSLPTQVYTAAYQRLEAILALADEVQPSDEIRSRAIDYLKKHPLSAADSLQLAAAFAAHQPSIVSLDHRLRAAAQAEGFVVLP